MKTLSMTKTMVLSSLLVLAAGAPAIGGSKFTGNGSVAISIASNGSGGATGYLGHIYNGSGSQEFLHCQRSKWDNVDLPVVLCWARNERGETASCTRQSAHLAKSVSSISSDSKVTFRFDAGGNCTSITVVQSSEYQDKQ
jgi:hypothetical protein